MAIWKIVVIVILVLLAGLLAFAATRPDQFSVQRSTSVNAPPEKIAALIGGMHNFNRWNPYLLKDPQLKGSYSGPENGPGSHYAWQGNKDVGKGSMTVTGVQPQLVEIDLDFIEPFASKNKAVFTLQPGTAGTQVTWAMHGPAPYITKLMGVVFNMDKMIGTDFETGLQRLKALAEQP